MNRSYLQGIPWHEEQMKRTCKNGSKYCMYNKNICICKASINYHKKCIGKGDCEEFESKGNTAKSYSENTLKTTKEKTKMNEFTNSNIEEIEESIIPNESPEAKFKRLSKSRIDKTVNYIRTISNLANKSLYTYTDEEVNKMFNHLQKALDKAKKSFQQEEFMDEFKWDE